MPVISYALAQSWSGQGFKACTLQEDVMSDVLLYYLDFDLLNMIVSTGLGN